MPEPPVSVVVSTYLGGADASRRANLLNCTLASLRCQTHERLEVLVVHNGPTGAPGDTATLLWHEIQRNHLWADWWQAPENRGRYGHEWRIPAAARTRGEYLGLQNDDHYMAPCYVERLVARLEAGADLALCDFVHGFAEDVPGYEPYQAMRTEPRVGRCDVGNFLARRELVLSTPWTDFGPRGDGVFVAAMAATPGVRVALEPRLLYVHD